MSSKRKAAIVKGEKIPCEGLRQYLYGNDAYRQASMLRKGREVHKIYVDVHKGVSFMDDRFGLTDFGNIVLESGTVRAGRARNVRQIVVARETLYCSGTTGCMRACGGLGQCLPNCDKVKVRGHKCSFRVKLTMRLGFVDHWFVEILGSHNSFMDVGSSVGAMTYQCKISASSNSTRNCTNPGTSQESSPSLPLNTESAHHFNCHLPEVAALLRHNCAATSPAASAAAFCEQHCVSTAISYVSPPAHLIIPNFTEPLPVAAHHRHAVNTGDSLAKPFNTQPQLASLDLSLKSEPQGRCSRSGCCPAEVGGILSQMSCEAPQSNGHATSGHEEWSVGSGFLKSCGNLNFLCYSAGVCESSTAGAICSMERSSSMSTAVSEDHVGSDVPLVMMSGLPDIPRVLWQEDNNFEGIMGHGCMIDSVNSDDNTKVINGHLDVDREEDIEEKKDLILRVRQLESHVTQLRNIVLKGQHIKGCKVKAQRSFDFSKYNTRHVALKVTYLGWDYQGFVTQEDCDNTIEAALFSALIKTQLVENRETANYHRCGRTDKGVSAFCQVISLDLRSNLLNEDGVKVREHGTAHLRSGNTETEIRYCHVMNKVLPPEIRVLAWASVPDSFSARFSCKKRTYKYFFPRGDLDLKLMSAAAAKLVGEHDFRNLCKMDVANGVVSFKRRIIQASVSGLDGIDSDGYSMCELTVVGQAFLWHQIRCIVTVLLLIAQGKEEPKVIDDLLDVDKCPQKPQYGMASELPLILFDCEFGGEVDWVYEADCHEDNIQHLQQTWAQHAIKTCMLKRMLQGMDESRVLTGGDIAPWRELGMPVVRQCDSLSSGNKPRVYRPLLQRQKCESLQERVQHFTKRQKTAHSPSSVLLSATPESSSPLLTH